MEALLTVWHNRLGHPAANTLNLILQGLNLYCNKHFTCNSYDVAKSHRTPLPLSTNKSILPLQLLHADVWGLAKVTTPLGCRFYLLIVDDFSRFSWLFLIKNKSDVLSMFTDFQRQVENLFSTKIKVLRTNGGGWLLMVLSRSCVLNQVSLIK